jgi:alpha-beta hydrolase superfamily lysophospholipase
MKITRRRLASGFGAGAALALTGCASLSPAGPVASEWQSFAASDGVTVWYRRWLPAGRPRDVVQIVHGAAEHSGRYDRFAQALVRDGHAVYATDHRGHGRTRLRSGATGDAGPDGWNRMVEDEIAFSQRLREAHPGAKLVLFGHSLGSFMAQDYITRRPELLDALVLSGTSYGPPPPQQLLDALDAAAKADPLGPSAFWANLFKDFNKPFSAQPGFEWLSRDPAEVAKYTADPLCGFAFSNELVRDIFVGFARFRDPAREARIPKTLPVLVIQGELDPVGENLKGTRALIERLRALGLSRVEQRFYTGARHELLNETNREQVQSDVIAWIDKTVA